MVENEDATKAIDNLQQSRAAASDAGRRLSKIVESLRSFTRHDEAEFQLADVRDGIESTLSLLEPHWGERIRVVRELDDVPAIESYPTELNQALMTLLVNAGEAIDDGGTITVKPPARTDTFASSPAIPAKAYPRICWRRCSTSGSLRRTRGCG